MDANIQWSPRMQVGSSRVDNQHKVIFDLIKDINRSIGAGANMQVLDTLLSVVRNYAFKHFETEEEYFKNHPDYPRHCLEHYKLIKELNTFIINFRNNRKDGEKEPSAFLENWLTRHIEEYDKPFFFHETANLSLMNESDRVDEYEPKIKERRLSRRIHHKDVVDGDIRVHCYNASRLKSGTATIVDMSTGGLLLHSRDVYEIDDLLVVTCSIGANFKMKEKVRVKRSDKKIYGVEFISPSSVTIEFLTKLYGAVHLHRNTRLP
ncbi:MAG: bacteriohemerythrin [Desulfocapsaceae bacterium]|nr:bacteriohemerythrin [Desulfocapsaceae bacterium]